MKEKSIVEHISCGIPPQMKPSVETNIFVHTKIPGVSRECLPPSKQIPGSPFLMVNVSPAPSQTQIEAIINTLCCFLAPKAKARNVLLKTQVLAKIPLGSIPRGYPGVKRG
jgi:hypothetical protein